MKRYYFLLICIMFSWIQANTQKDLGKEIQKLMLELKKSDDTSRIKIKFRIGRFYLLSNNTDSAIYYLNSVIEESRRINFNEGLIRAYNGMGFAYSSMENDTMAITYFLKALKVAEDTNGDPREMYTNIATIYMNQKNFSAAVPYLIKNEKISLEKKDTFELIVVYSNWAGCYAEQKNSPSAQEKSDTLFRKAQMLLSFFERNNKSALDDHDFLKAKKNVYLNYSNLMVNMNNPSKALLALKYIESEVLRSGNKKEKMWFLSRLSNVNLALKKNSEALKNASDGIVLADESLYSDVSRDLYLAQSDAYIEMNRYQEGYNSFKKFKEISDTLLSKETIRVTNELVTKYDTKKKDQEIIQLNKEKKSQRTIIGLSLGAATVALGFLVSAIRSRKLQQKLFIQKEELSTKEKEIEMKVLEKKMTELEQMALRAQMNPHFIFNSLNSVQHYVMKQDVEGVNKYLSAFAHLIRQTLNNSGKQFVSVEEEIKYLDTYLSLEKMKSNNQFNYSIHVDEAVDRSATFIPGMILQPYVENSIKHGVTHKEHNDGQVTISLSKNDKLVCVIEDNGVGRQKANEIKAERGPAEFESRGMSITANRIETINKIYNTDINIQVNDRMDQGGKLSGTTVRLEFPANLE